MNKYKAIAKVRIQKKDWYDFEAGTVFKVLNVTKYMIQVEDFLGFNYWLKSNLLELVPVK